MECRFQDTNLVQIPFQDEALASPPVDAWWQSAQDGWVAGDHTGQGTCALGNCKKVFPLSIFKAARKDSPEQLVNVFDLPSSCSLLHTCWVHDNEVWWHGKGHPQSPVCSTGECTPPSSDAGYPEVVFSVPRTLPVTGGQSLNAWWAACVVEWMGTEVWTYQVSKEGRRTLGREGNKQRGEAIILSKVSECGFESLQHFAWGSPGSQVAKCYSYYCSQSCIFAELITLSWR